MGDGPARAGRALAALAALALVVACSGSDAPASRSSSGDGTFAVALQQANLEGRERAAEISRLSASAKGQGLDRTLEIYAAIAEQARRTRDRYAALPVPPPVAGEMAGVVRLLTDQVEALEELEPTARSGDRDRTAALLARLSGLTADLQAARARLDAALSRCGSDCTE